MKIVVFLLSLIAAFSLAVTPGLGEQKMELSSPVLKDKGRIETKYTMPDVGGKNISLPLAWTNAPEETKSFALSMVDPHPVAKNWVHWLVINIPASAASLGEGASKKAMPSGSVELKNSFGDIGYGGPQPPQRTGDHPYVITVYALNVDRLDLGMYTNLTAFRDALKGKILSEATMTGYFSQ
jgi:Raf kinase inhibitor-like YbhB/YbcL family protein